MKAAIYNPYLDTLGGGERYTCAVAEALLNVGYEVFLEWKNGSEIVDKLGKRFGKDLSSIKVVDDVKRGDGYDACFWVSDGSIPTLKSRKNLLHFQVPFTNVSGNTLLNKMKLFRVNKVVVNSNFTKSFIDKEYGVNSVVIYPPVDTEKIKPIKKENLILYVGRFSKLVQSKRQDVLIKAFKKLSKLKEFSNWKLVIAGGSEVGVDGYVQELKKLSEGLNVKIIENPAFSELTKLYGKAKFFWSASGYGSDENLNPEKTEHFGITTVEAMAGAAVPVIFNAGGQKEIVENEINGFVWNRLEELIKHTKDVAMDTNKLRKLSQNALNSVQKYGYTRFEKEILNLL